MSNVTFFFAFIPLLALILLAVNFIFATHSPYQEKNSTFECGFHSFLGQNRMQFNISFYIFGLLFLLFDLEILLIYPYPVSAQSNSLYGLCTMLVFFIILTIGFIFELGKGALKIESRQYLSNTISYNKNKKSGSSKVITSIFNVNFRGDKVKLSKVDKVGLLKLNYIFYFKENKRGIGDFWVIKKYIYIFSTIWTTVTNISSIIFNCKKIFLGKKLINDKVKKSLKNLFIYFMFFLCFTFVFKYFISFISNIYIKICILSILSLISYILINIILKSINSKVIEFKLVLRNGVEKVAVYLLINSLYLFIDISSLTFLITIMSILSLTIVLEILSNLNIIKQLYAESPNPEDSDADAEGTTDEEAENSNINPSQRESDINWDDFIYAEAYANDGETNIQAEAKAESKSESESDVDAEVDAEVDADVDADVEAEAEAEVEASAQTSAQAARAAAYRDIAAAETLSLDNNIEDIRNKYKEGSVMHRAEREAQRSESAYEINSKSENAKNDLFKTRRELLNARKDVYKDINDARVINEKSNFIDSAKKEDNKRKLNELIDDLNDVGSGLTHTFKRFK